MSADTDLDMIGTSLCYTSALSLFEDRGGIDLLPSSNLRHTVDYSRDSRQRRSSPQTKRDGERSRDVKGAGGSSSLFHAPAANSIVEKRATEAFDLSAPLRHALFTAALVVPLSHLKKTMTCLTGSEQKRRPELFSLPAAVLTPNSRETAGHGITTTTTTPILPARDFEDKKVQRRTSSFDRRKPETAAAGNGRTEPRFKNLPTDGGQAGKRTAERRTGPPDEEDKRRAGRATEESTGKGAAAHDQTPQNEMELIGNLINNNTSSGDAQLAFIDD